MEDPDICVKKIKNKKERDCPYSRGLWLKHQDSSAWRTTRSDLCQLIVCPFTTNVTWCKRLNQCYQSFTLGEIKVSVALQALHHGGSTAAALTEHCTGLLHI